MHRIHISLYEYQYEYLKDNDYNISEVIRTELDGRMIEEGADPDQWRESSDG